MKEKTKLFALPYAFGSAYIYNDLKDIDTDKYEVIPLEYPGHGSRFGEELLEDIHDIAYDVYRQMRNYVRKSDGNYAIMGYSMGGIIAFELYKLIKEHKLQEPKAFFAFASSAPSRKYSVEEYEKYDLYDVKEYLKKMNGTSKEVLENEELLELFQPIVVGDLVALRDYNDNYSDIKIECPLIVVRGSEEIDSTTYNWDDFSNGDSYYYQVEGEHFFMFENEKNLIDCKEIIEKVLA